MVFIHCDIFRFTNIGDCPECDIFYFTLLKKFLLLIMTIDQAFQQLIETAEFKEIARVKDSKGGKYRSYLSLFKRGQLKVGAIVALLIDHGYEIKANKATRKVPKK